MLFKWRTTVICETLSSSASVRVEEQDSRLTTTEKSAALTTDGRSDRDINMFI